jgi:PAS domain S-box-containing protein
MSETTEQKRAEHLNAVLRAIRNVNQIIAREKDCGRLLQGVCDNLIQTRGYRYAWIALLDASHQLVTAAYSGLGEEFGLLIERMRHGDLPACVRKSLASAAAIPMHNAPTECAECPMADTDRNHTPMAVRLGWGGDVYGVLVASIPGDFSADQEERELLEEVAGDIAFAVHDLRLQGEQARAEDALRLEQARLNALLELNQMTEAPLQAITDFALEEAVRLTQSRIGYLAFMNEDESVLTMHAWSKTAMDQCAVIDKPIEYPVETTGLWGEAVRQRQPVITNDYMAPNPLKKGHPEGHVPIVRHMNVPIFDGERIVAVAGVGNKIQTYDESDVRQLTLLMQGMWRLVQRRQAAEQLRCARDELEVRVKERTAELAAANEELKLERYLLHSLMDHLPHNIYFKDERSRFIRINRALATCFGLSDPSEALNKTDRDFFTSSHADQAFVDEQEIIRTGRPVIDKEEEETWSDGHTTWATTTKMPLYDEAGRIVGTFGVSRDITEQKLAAVALENAVEAAEAANHAKSAFLANMSHEIRTPLNAVIGMTELVLNTELAPQQREFLTAVRDSGEALLSVINDILDFSKIEAGKLVLDPKKFDLRESLGDTMKSFAIRAHQQGLELACQIHPDVPRMVVGDYHRLRQIIVNLVGNAVKFTERGEVVMEVACEDVSGDEATLHFTITDTGIGIPEEKLTSIFDVFEQADVSLTRRHGGTGLGLAIAMRLATMMGGSVRVESELGQGSRFHFTVRLKLAQVDDSEDVVIVPSCLHGLEVLVVDDNATNRRILAELLISWHMKPMLAGSALEAVDLLQRAYQDGSPFRLVLTDAHMPNTDGFTLTKQIKSESNFANPIVIMLTSGDRVEDTARCEELGIAAYLLKPVKQSELLEAIELALGVMVPKRELTRDLEEPSRHHGPLRILLAEDSLVNQKLAVALLEKHGHRLTVVNNGIEAVSAFDQEEFDLILMDVQMPVMDGLEACASIRQRESASGRHIPIIAMTAYALKGDRQRCLDAGMDGYVSKPIRVQELYTAIATHFLRSVE